MAGTVGGAKYGHVSLVCHICVLFGLVFVGRVRRVDAAWEAGGAKLPDATVDGIPAVLAWADKWVTSAEDDWAARHGGSLKHGRMASPAKWHEQIVYQIMPDRFNNGNLSNDKLNLPPQQRDADPKNPEGLPDFRHGGDVAGITERLDYILDLGATTLWVTPLLHHDGLYHGYCITDPTSIDPGFGTLDELHELVDEAHKRGIYVVLDVVINHLCDDLTNYSTPTTDHAACADALNANYWAGTPGGAPQQGNLSLADTFFPPLRNELFFNRCGPNQMNDTASEEPVAVFGDFTWLMFDLDTRNVDLMNITTHLLQYWVALADFDGFRFDAVKHVTDDYVAHMCTEIRTYAQQKLGKDNFFIVGEVAASSDWEGRALGKMFSDPDDPTQHGTVPQALTSRLLELKEQYLNHSAFPLPGLNAIYDFYVSGTSRDVLLGQNGQAPQAIADYFSSSAYATTAAQADPRDSWTMLEIHDWPRLLHDQPLGDVGIGVARTGAALLLTMPGMPIIWAGLEQGFAGRCNESAIDAGTATASIVATCEANQDASWRQDMFVSGPWRLESVVDEVNDLAFIGTTTPKRSPTWTEDPMLARDHAVYQTVRQLTNVRKSCAPLMDDRVAFRAMSTVPSQGPLFFSRLSTSMEVVVAINPWTAPLVVQSIPIDGTINAQNQGRNYVDLFDTSNNATASVSGSQATLQFPDGYALAPHDFAVFVLDSEVGPLDNATGVHLCAESTK